MTSSWIGRYQVVGTLGRGGMGVVYEVRDPSLPERRLALKQIHRELLDEQALARFRREAELLAKIEHKNVIRVHACELEPVAYLVTELVEGEELSAAAQRGLEPVQAAEIAAQLCDAVGALHQRGILHRDLKPGNAILRPDGTPVLLDFGLAREADGQSLTQSGDVLGSPEYMPPEQANSERDKIDERSDVYGLGGIWFALLSRGAPPYGPGSLANVLFAVLKKEPKWEAIASAPPDAQAIARQAMAREREERYPSPTALAQDLRRFAAGKPVRARPRTRRPKLIAVAIALLALTGLVLGAWKLNVPSPETPSPSAEPTLASPTPSPSRRKRDPLLGAARRLANTVNNEGVSAAALAFVEEHPEHPASSALLRPLLAKLPLWRVPVPNTGEVELIERGAVFVGRDRAVSWNGLSPFLEVFNARTGKHLTQLDVGHSVNSLIRMPSGEFLAGAALWKLTSFRIENDALVDKRPFPVGFKKGEHSQQAIRHLAMNHAGSLLIGLGFNKRRRGKQGTYVARFEGERATLTALPFSPPLVARVAWSADGQVAYAVGNVVQNDNTQRGDAVKGWRDDEVVFSGGGVDGDIRALTCVPQHGILAFGGSVRRIHLVDTAKGKASQPLNGKLTQGFNPTSHRNSVTALVPSPDGNWLYSAGGHYITSGTQRTRAPEVPSELGIWTWSQSAKTYERAKLIPMPRARSTIRWLDVSEDDRVLLIYRFGWLEAWCLPALRGDPN